MDPLLFAVVSVSVAVAALTVYVGGGLVKANKNTGTRLSSLQTREDVLEQDFSERAVAPVMQGLGRFAIAVHSHRMGGEVATQAGTCSME